MKHILLIIAGISTLLSSNIILANQEKSLNKSFETVKKQLEKSKIDLTVFNNTKIYKQNGAMLGLMKKHIDVAIVKNDFLKEIIDGEFNNDSLEKIKFSILKSGENYSFIVYNSFKEKYTKKDRDTFLDIINKELKDF